MLILRAIYFKNYIKILDFIIQSIFLIYTIILFVTALLFKYYFLLTLYCVFILGRLTLTAIPVLNDYFSPVLNESTKMFDNYKNNLTFLYYFIQFTKIIFFGATFYLMFSSNIAFVDHSNSVIAAKNDFLILENVNYLKKLANIYCLFLPFFIGCIFVEMLFKTYFLFFYKNSFFESNSVENKLPKDSSFTEKRVLSRFVFNSFKNAATQTFIVGKRKAPVFLVSLTGMLASIKLLTVDI